MATKVLFRHAARWEAGGATAPPDLGRSEGAAGQRRLATLLPAPRIFDPCCIPAVYLKMVDTKLGNYPAW